LLACVLLAVLAPAARAADPPGTTTPSSDPTPVPVQTPPTPAPDPAPVPVHKTAPKVTRKAAVKPAATPTRTVHRSSSTRSTRVVQAPRVTYTPQPVYKPVVHKAVAHKAKPAHRRQHKRKPAAGAVLGARHTVAAKPRLAPIVAVATTPLQTGGGALVTAFWILALMLPLLMLLAAVVPVSVLPYEFALEWMHRRPAIAAIGVTMLVLDGTLYLLG
jgi:hypothetical protein